MAQDQKHADGEDADLDPLRELPAFAEITAVGRAYHCDWVARVFAPWLDTRAGAGRERLHAQLVAVCDVYTWFLLRRQAGLSRRSAEEEIGDVRARD